MVQYIYFVKCPNCEDEPFDFFDEAKDFALGCMSKKPIITQIEVCRNDFGECTDSNDLGTVWSWEDMMKETNVEPTCSVFTKDDFKDFEGDYNPENDPEFANMDNSVDFEPEISEVSAIDEVPDNFRKPIPEGMTIESLVEEMEENEDTVECKVCNDLFNKEDCHYETDMGYLCPTCKKAIKSRGETLTFEEDHSLTEAVYRNIINLPDAKDKILDIAKLAADAVDYINNDNTINPATAKTQRGVVGAVTDFEVVNGELIVTLDRGNGRSNELELDTLLRGGFFPTGLRRDCQAYALLTVLRNAARDLNRQVGAVGARNLNANASVRNNPEAAEELKAHIVNIRYEIPYGNYSVEDFSSDPDNAEAAFENLENIRTRFFEEWPYGDAAEAAGLVTERSIYNSDNELCDSVYYIATQWHAVGKITFDCRISQLSETAQNIIKNSKVSGSFDNNTNKKEIDCIRLAYALTSYYEDVEFFKKPTAPVEENLTEASLGDILANAGYEHNTKYSERDFLDDEGFEDLKAFADLETQNEITAEAQRNKRRRQAYAIARAKERKALGNKPVTES